jgi:hypothetical protein
MIPCPVKGCTHRCNDPETLYGHLYVDHVKSQIISALVREVSKSESKS